MNQYTRISLYFLNKYHKSGREISFALKMNPEILTDNKIIVLTVVTTKSSVQFSSVHIFISHKSKHTKKFDYIS